jgi:hypothetical protein
MAEVSKAQIEDLGAKLEKFAKDLPKAERDVLGWVLQRASTAGGELSDEEMKGVAGGLSSAQLGGFQRPTSAMLGRALGGGGFQNPGDMLAFRISWSW